MAFGSLNMHCHRFTDTDAPEVVKRLKAVRFLTRAGSPDQAASVQKSTQVGYCLGQIFS